MKRTLLISSVIASLFLSAHGEAPPRDRISLDDGWKFLLADPRKAQDPAFDDSSWRTVTLPHDWSIEGKFDPKAPMGGGGGFLPAGVAWYRDTIAAPDSWKGKTVSVEFEGVYMNADVWLNGQHLTFHPYGYTSFNVDLTPALRPGGNNILAVRVDNSEQKNSRWYSGSGIYRHVWLTVTGPVHVAPWGVFASTLAANSQTATISVQTQVANDGAAPVEAKVEGRLLGPDGKLIGSFPSATCQVPPGGGQKVTVEVPVNNPALWSPETPQISHVVTTVSVNGTPVDETDTPFGIRAIAWSATDGLTLNGKTYKLSGGCIHDDNGVLGACAFNRAEERKIELLKAAGYNAIRTAHNPPSPELLDACDRQGMLVLDEAFDCWAVGKNTFDYHVVFKDWWQRDIDSMVERDRNHPAVVMWSIGNEIPDLMSAMGAEYGPRLSARIHSLDKTRPVTNGILGWPVDPKKPKPNDAERQAAADANWNSLDIVGTNYNLDHHISQHDQFPNRVLVSTESNPPVGTALQVRDHPYVVGDFVWSAQDYLGESGVGRWFYEGDPTEPLNPPKDPSDKTPHPIMHGSDRLYPWHGANCGSVDILGNDKPAGHLRDIVWNQGEKLYMAVRQPEDGRKIIGVGWGWFPTWESWTWPGEEGKPMQVEVYSRYEKVRLYLNGTLIAENPVNTNNARTTFTLPYAAGTLKAVGVQDGKEVETCQLATTGEPAAIRLTPDRDQIKADEQDLSFVKVEVVDKAGNVQPNADQEITFAITGPGTIAGLGNANLKDTTPYQGTQCHVFHGRALVVIRSGKTPGPIQLTASSGSLGGGSASIQAR